jgi:hypothetical protein
MFVSFVANCQIINKQKITNGLSYVNVGGIDGIIFSKDVIIVPQPGDTLQRVTPTKTDVLAAERIIKDHLQYNAEENSNWSYVNDNYRSYVRQYCSFVNSKGEVLVYINALWRKNILDDIKFKKDDQTIGLPLWYEQWIIVLDGGNSYWQGLINITTKKVVMFSVNGVA